MMILGIDDHGHRHLGRICIHSDGIYLEIAQTKTNIKSMSNAR